MRFQFVAVRTLTFTISTRTVHRRALRTVRQEQLSILFVASFPDDEHKADSVAFAESEVNLGEIEIAVSVGHNA